MAITRVGGSWIHKYVSLVADDVTHAYTKAAKPELNLPNGSRCFEMDSDTEYIYDRENDAWEVYIPSSGGSGGTTNYNQLSNKPKINNVELSGNKTLAALGINAGAIGFDETETYSDGSVGKEVSDQKNAISQLQPTATASDVGKALIVKTVDTQTGKPTSYEYGGGSGGAVNDVQINGNSIVSGGVADIPLASSSTVGAVKIGGGITITGSGTLQLSAPTDGQIKGGINDQLAVKINIQHKSAFYGLAKAAGDSTQSSSGNPVGTYTEDAKSAIHGMLNAPVTVSGTTPSITAKSGITYVCGEVATLDITLPASGIFEVQFVSGSTPTVLTAAGVSWAGGFDPTALEANKTYDISVSNGIGVAVWI